jgi:hypothetical protein
MLQRYGTASQCFILEKAAVHELHEKTNKFKYMSFLMLSPDE